MFADGFGFRRWSFRPGQIRGRSSMVMRPMQAASPVTMPAVATASITPTATIPMQATRAAAVRSVGVQLPAGLLRMRGLRRRR